MYQSILENVAQILERVKILRPEGGVSVMAATKNHSREEALAAITAGVPLIGENRVQEARDKWIVRPPVPLHLIGHLQTNKVKYAIELFDVIQSVDSERVAEALNQRAGERRLSIMIQVNAGKEPNKMGLHPEEVLAFLARGDKWPNLCVTGLMVVLPQARDSSIEENQRIRRYMQEMAELWRMCRREGFPWAPLQELSMGMSGDWEWAVESGATMIRLGTALMGPRIQK